MARLLLLVMLLAAVAPAQRKNEPRGEAGKFDLYVLALSWSPRHCSTPPGKRDDLQCNGTRKYGFIVHGLWPQYEKGWPQSCASRQILSKEVVEETLDIMPSRDLIRHEWSRHGVCDGTAPRAYFFKARGAFQKVKIPESLVQPVEARRVKPEVIRQEFVAANPAVMPEAFSVTCSGRFLQEVRVCLTKDLQARACTADVERQACNVPEIIIQPLR